jgi:hypothetical protein
LALVRLRVAPPGGDWPSRVAKFAVVDIPLAIVAGDKVSDCSTAGFTVRMAVEVTPLKVAERVTAVGTSTPAVVIVNAGEAVVPPGMITDAGTDAAAGFELERLTSAPPAGAVWLKLMVLEGMGLPLSTAVCARFTMTSTPTAVPLRAIV